MAVRYPSDFTADSPGTDYLELKFIRRDYTSDKVKYVVEGDTIILNIPQKVTESHSQNFAMAAKGELGNADIFGRAGGPKGPNVFIRATQRLIENYGLNLATEVMTKLGASQLTDNGILSATGGVVYNPNLEVLYDGPDFRKFNFQFALFTKSKNDAKNIKKIVDSLRKASLPSSTGTPNNQQIGAVFTDVAATETVGAAGGTAVAVLAKKLNISTGANGLSSLVNTAGAFVSGLASGTGAIFSGDSRFITQPPFILITYKRGAGNHPFIQPLLPASINQISFDFTPTGNYTTLANFDATDEATTIGVTITMQVTEVTNLFSDVLFTKRAPGIDGA